MGHQHGMKAWLECDQNHGENLSVGEMSVEGGKMHVGVADIGVLLSTSPAFASARSHQETCGKFDRMWDSLSGSSIVLIDRVCGEDEQAAAPRIVCIEEWLLSLC